MKLLHNNIVVQDKNKVGSFTSYPGIDNNLTSSKDYCRDLCQTDFQFCWVHWQVLCLYSLLSPPFFSELLGLLICSLKCLMSGQCDTTFSNVFRRRNLECLSLSSIVSRLISLGTNSACFLGKKRL